MVPLQRVYWDTDKTADFASNFEVLVSSLKKFQVQKEVPVERLMAGDKTELAALLDWLKSFSLSNRKLGVNYDPVGRRGGHVPNFKYVDKIRLRNQESDSLASNLDKKSDNPFSSQKPMVMTLDARTVQKLAHFEAMKAEKEFYFSKLRDIDQVLDSYKDSSVKTLIHTIREIIYLSASEGGVVSEDGHFLLKGERDTRFDEAQNITANFQGSDFAETDIGHFGFGRENIDLLSEGMALEHPANN